MTETSTERHKQVCYELNMLYDQKNRDYGDSFHETYKAEGMAMSRIRLMDKLNRFCTITRGQNAPNVASESVRDTLLDLANYAIMTVMEMDEEGERPISSVYDTGDYRITQSLHDAVRKIADSWTKEDAEQYHAER